MGFLSEKVASVAERLRASPPDAAQLRDAADRWEPRGFAAALGVPSPGLIAEVKRASPSVGHIAETEPGPRGAAYEAAGATAVSVLTDTEHFGGSLDDLTMVRRATDRVPVLRKDFLIDPVQLLEARAAGADAVLLIAACLSSQQLVELLEVAAGLDLGVLLETHSPGDLERALATDALVIGVNSRDLETLEVDVDRALAQLGDIPSDRIAVMESGIADRGDVVRAVGAGARAVLVGEALMRADDAAAKVKELLGGTR